MNHDTSLYQHLINKEFDIWENKYLNDKNITHRFTHISELFNNIESITLNEDFLRHILLNVLIKVELQYEPSFFNDLNHQIRFIALEIIERYPFDQFSDVSIVMYIVNSMMKLLVSDNEENAIICLRITNILCTLFEHIIDELVPQFISFIESIYENYQIIIKLKYFPIEENEDHLHKATNSFKVMNECFNILFRFWHKFFPIIESFSYKLFPLCLSYIKIISNDNDNVNSLDYIDFRTSQVHTFHLLLFIMDFCPNSSNFIEDILMCLATQLKNCSSDEENLRKEILILSRDFLRYFKDNLTNNMIIHFTDERNLIGYSPVYASYDIKVLAFKIMCDILGYKMRDMNLGQLEMMIYFFCRSIQDKTFPTKVHIHSIQLIMECLKSIHESPFRESFNSVILIRVIQTFNVRYGGLYNTIKKISKMLTQIYLSRNLINEYNLYQLCKIFNATEIIERRMRLEEVYNESIIYTINDILTDIKRLLKTLSAAIREVVTRFCVIDNDNSYRFDGVNMLCERLSTNKLISNGLKCLRIFTKSMNQLFIEKGLKSEEELNKECEIVIENTIYFLDVSDVSIIYDVLYKQKDNIYNLIINYQYPYTILPRKIIEKMRYHFIEELFLTFFTNRLSSNKKDCEDKMLIKLIEDLFKENCISLSNNIVPYTLELTKLSLKKAFSFNSTIYLTLINSIFKFLATFSFNIETIEELTKIILEIAMSKLSPTYSDLKLELYKTCLTIPTKILSQLSSKNLVLKLIVSALELNDLSIKELSFNLFENLIDSVPFGDLEKDFEIYKHTILNSLLSYTYFPLTRMTSQSIRIIGKLSGLGVDIQDLNMFSLHKLDQNDITVSFKFPDQSLHQFSIRDSYKTAARFIKNVFKRKINHYTKNMLEISFELIKSCISLLLLKLSSSSEKTLKRLEYCHLTFKKLLQSVIISTSFKEIQYEGIQYFESLCLHFVLQNSNDIVNESDNGTQEFIEALVKSTSILEKHGVISFKPLEIFIHTINKFLSPKVYLRKYIIDNLVNELKSNCYKKEWYYKKIGCIGLYCILSNLPLPIVESYHIDAFNSFAFIIDDTDPFVSQDIIDIASEGLMYICMDVSDKNTEELMRYIIQEINSYCSPALKVMFTCLSLISQLKGFPFHEIFEEFKVQLVDPLNNINFNTIPPEKKLGYIETLFYCVKYNLEVLKDFNFTEILKPILDELSRLIESNTQSNESLLFRITSLELFCCISKGIDVVNIKSDIIARIISFFMDSIMHFDSRINILALKGLDIMSISPISSGIVKSHLQQLITLLIECNNEKNEGEFLNCILLILKYVKYATIESPHLFINYLSDRLTSDGDLQIIKSNILSLFDNKIPCLVIEILQLYHLKPQDIQLVISIAIQLEAYFSKNMNECSHKIVNIFYNYYRPCLFKLLDRYPSEVLEYFYNHLGDFTKFLLFKSILNSNQNEMIKKEILINPQSFIKATFNCPKTTQEETREIRLNGIIITTILIKHIPDFLKKNKEIVQCLLNMWTQIRDTPNHLDFFINNSLISETKLIAKCLIQYCKQCKEDSNTLFTLVSMFSTNNSTDLDEIDDYCTYYIQSHYSDEEKSNLLKSSIDLFIDPGNTNNIKLQILKKIINPLVKHCFEENNFHVLNSNIISVLVENLIIKDHYKEHEILLEADIESFITIEVLVLAAQFAKNLFNDLTCFEKPLLEFGWYHFKTKDRRLKHYANIFMGYYISLFGGQKKLFLKVYANLLNSFEDYIQSEAINCIKQLIPKLYTLFKNHGWISITVKMLLNKRHSMSQRHHIVKIIKQNASYYYPFRSELVNSLIRLRKPAIFDTIEGMKLTIKKLQIILQWKVWEYEEYGEEDYITLRNCKVFKYEHYNFVNKKLLFNTYSSCRLNLSQEQKDKIVLYLSNLYLANDRDILRQNSFSSIRPTVLVMLRYFLLFFKETNLPFDILYEYLHENQDNPKSQINVISMLQLYLDTKRFKMFYKNIEKVEPILKLLLSTNSQEVAFHMNEFIKSYKEVLDKQEFDPFYNVIINLFGQVMQSKEKFDLEVLFILNNSFISHKKTLWIPLLLLNRFINNSILGGRIQNEVKNHEESIESLIYTLGLSVYLMESMELESFLHSLFLLIDYPLNWSISYVILNILNDVFKNNKQYILDSRILSISKLMEIILESQDMNNSIYEIIIQLCQILEEHHNFDHIYMKIALTTTSFDIRSKSLDLIKRRFSDDINLRLEMIFNPFTWKPVYYYYWIPICIDLILDHVSEENILDIHLPLPSLNPYPPELKEYIDTNIHFLKSSYNNKPVLNFIREFIYADTNYASNLWSILFPSLWSIMLQVNLCPKFILFLEQLILDEEMISQQYLYPNVIQTLLKGVILCQESNIVLSPELLKKSALEYRTWFDSIYILEKNVSLSAYNHRFNEFSKYLAELYEILGHYDYYYVITQYSSDKLTHKDAIMFTKYSMYEKASKEYIKCMESTFSSKDEYQFWRKEYCKCLKELSQWDDLSIIDNNDAEIDLVLEALWKQSDWNSLRQILNTLTDNEPSSIIYRCYLCVKDDHIDSLNNLSQIYLNDLLREWNKYPQIINRNTEFIHSLQKLLEIHKSTDILKAIKNGDTTLIKNILNNWNYRQPNNISLFSQWHEILLWRKEFLQTITITDDNLNVKEEIIRTQLKLSNIARKKNLHTLSHNILSEINASDLNDQENMFKYANELLKHQISHNPCSVLEIINTLNLNNLTNEQLSEIYSLKAKLFKHHNDKQENNHYFESAQYNFKNSKNWLEWGKFHDKCFEEELSDFRKRIIHMCHAIYCYLQCIVYNQELRYCIPRILYFFTHNHNGIYNGTIVNSTHFLLSPTHRTNLFPIYSEIVPDVGFTEIIQLIFDNYNNKLPPWIWVKWIPYLISALDRPEVEIAKKLLMRISEYYPNSSFFPIKLLVEQTQNQSSKTLFKVAIELMDHVKSLHPLLCDRLMKLTESISEVSKLELHEKFLHEIQLIYVNIQNQYLNEESANIQLNNIIDLVRNKSKSLDDILEKNSSIIKNGKVISTLETLINEIKHQYPPKWSLLKHELFSQSFISDKIELFGKIYENQSELDNRIYILIFKQRMKILNSFGNPKRIMSVLCDDGTTKYFYLDSINYKVQYDRKVEKNVEWERENRINHILRLMNNVFMKFNETRKRNVKICTPSYLQISMDMRIISLEDINTISLYDIYEDWCYRNNVTVFFHLKSPERKANQPPDLILLKYFEVLLQESCESFWKFRNCLSISFGVYSLIQYLFSVLYNDPYHINILCNSAQVIQNSFYPNVNEDGKITSPHMVPFRLTPNIQKLIGTSLGNGAFKTSFTSSALALNSKKYNEIIQHHLKLYYYYDSFGLINHINLDKTDIINYNIQDFKNKLIHLLSEGKDREGYFYRSAISTIDQAIDMNNLATMGCAWCPWL